MAISSVMAKYTITHDRPACIGCAACEAIAPEFWTMSSADGKSDLVGSKHIKEGDAILKEELEMVDLKNNREAADCCPVNVIHIIDLKTGEKLI